MKKIAILGAGISGLATAWYLRKRLPPSYEISLFEATNRVGGWIHTIEKEGVPFERGPRALQASGPLLSLISELSLEDEMIMASHHSLKRYLLCHDTIEKLSLYFFFRHALIYDLIHEWRCKKESVCEESIAAYFERRFSRRFTEHLVDPIVRGIFGGDSEELSMQAAFPELVSLQKKERSLVRAIVFKGMKKRPLLSFSQGLKRLPDALYDALSPSIDIHLCEKIISLDRHTQVTLFSEKGANYTVDRLISTLPAWALKTLLKHTHPLLETPYRSISLVNMAYENIETPLKAFGFLAPKAASPLLGMSSDSVLFPELNGRAKTRLTLFFEGELKDAPTVAQKIVEKHFQIQENPFISDTFTAKHAIPQYLLGHQERISDFSDPLLFLTGSLCAGIGVTNLLTHAEKTAQKVAASLM